MINNDYAKNQQINQQPEGNYFNKYSSQNTIYKKLMDGFFYSLDGCLQEISYQRVFEAGCGEGYVTDFIYRSRNNLEIYASDLSEKVIKQAQEQWPHIKFQVGSIYDYEFNPQSFDLVVACEVLEHLQYPQKALEELLRITKRHLLISVPNEPVWRICNMLRGKYLSQLGNTPGHIQHWSSNQFCNMISQHCAIKKVEKPFPWTMLLCEK